MVHLTYIMKGEILMKKLIILFLSVLILAACGSETSTLTTDDVIQKFKDEGLEVGENIESTRKRIWQHSKRR